MKEKECIYIYIFIYIYKLGHCAVQQKLVQHCKSTILQLKNIKTGEKKKYCLRLIKGWPYAGDRRDSCVHTVFGVLSWLSW